MKLNPKTIILIFLSLAIIVLLIFTLTHRPPPNFTIIDSNPSPNQANVLDATPIHFRFNQPIPPSEQQHISYISSPQTNLTSSWPAPDQFTLNPTSPLTTDSPYTITLTYQGQSLHTLSFTTNISSTSDLRQQGSEQSIDDYQNSQVIQRTYDQHPWLDKLPLETSDYTIDYSFSQNQYRIILHQSNLDDEVKQSLTTKALEDIKSLGVTANPIPYQTLDPLL